MLSTKRAMVAFNTGKLDFDFFSPGWLPEGEPQGDFTFSHSILTVTEYFITLPEKQNLYADIKRIYGNLLQSAMDSQVLIQPIVICYVNQDGELDQNIPYYGDIGLIDS